jgi:hypothetical protein
MNNQNPKVRYITYAYDDPENAPVLDVSCSMAHVRYWMEGRSGFVYRVELLPESEWSDSDKPAYGNETFMEAI